jgi:hypothetical protein
MYNITNMTINILERVQSEFRGKNNYISNDPQREDSKSEN